MPAISSLDSADSTAVLGYRGRGNPLAAHVSSAISNCFPGLEFDFRATWKRILEDIDLHEASGEVVTVTPGSAAFAAGVRPGQLLATVDGVQILLPITGPREGDTTGTEVQLDLDVREFSNSLNALFDRAGQDVVCEFRRPNGATITATLRVRRIFADGGIVEDAAAPGVLTQGLCSPWQNDYRECGCYYWAASRPDYVNVEMDGDNDVGHNWLSKNRTAATLKIYRGEGAPPEVSYDELFRAWETELRFLRRGQDSE